MADFFGMGCLRVGFTILEGCCGFGGACGMVFANFGVNVFLIRLFCDWRDIWEETENPKIE